MVKVSSRDILDILRRFDVADKENLPRQVEMIKISHPSPINTLASFRFLKTQFYILFDNTAEDDKYYVISQIKTAQPNPEGELVSNRMDTAETYALPYKGKECYLFESTSKKRRLDIELAEKYPEISRSVWQKHIKSGYVYVNDKVVTITKYEIGDNDSISVKLPNAKDYSDVELPIIYLDSNVIVINKPNGVLTHSKGSICDEFTAADFFSRYSDYNKDTNRPGIVHRLDRDTSGVLIGARNSETATMLQKQFSDRRTKKVYYAIVDGVPKLEKANIDVPIGRNPAKPSTFRVDGNGKPAQTKYEVIASNNRKSLIKLQPLTGRTHQLRVHMQYINTPITGDRVYGKSDDRLYLHAYSLEITIPDGNRQLFKAPMPQDFLELFPGVSIE